MADLKEQALQIAVNRPSLAVMATGIIIMLYIVYHVFDNGTMTEFQEKIVFFFSVVSVVIFFVGIAMVFYRAKMDAEKEARAQHAPRVKRTPKQKDTCLQFRMPVPWGAAILMPCKGDVALLGDPEALLVALTACRINLGSTQGLNTITSADGAVIVESVIPTDETILGAT